jgi:ribosome biogenesis GTPase / thiamine phosphate phosphatase
MNIDLPALGWNADLAAAYRPFARSGLRPARVTRLDRGACAALSCSGTVRASLGAAVLDRAATDPVNMPCAGDWIVVRTWPDDRLTVEAVLPRRTAVVRASAEAAASGQVLAANMDAVAVVEAFDPEPDLGRIERLLTLAHNSGATPLVILTKADLLADPAAVAATVSAAAPSVPVYAVSSRTGAGLDRIRPLVAPGRTLGLLGASGVGKSSLVNALVGASVMGTRELRSDAKGRHTTTFRALVPVPGGGAVLDTPGIRSVGMYEAGPGLARAFEDITALAARCRFAGCAHLSEPGCAVRAAVESGALARRRLASWRKLTRELAHELHRREAREQRADMFKRRRVERLSHPRSRRSG